MVVPTICATSSHPHSAPKPTEPIPRFPQQHPKYSTSPPFPLGVLTKMLVAENLGVSEFKVLPQSAKQGIVY